MTLTVIKNPGQLVCMDDARHEIPDAAIAFGDGVIEAVGPTEALSERIAEASTVIDARGCVVTPGLVDTHHHLPQTAPATSSPWRVRIEAPQRPTATAAPR